MFGDIPLKEFILDWNLRFKYDRWFRKKYNIPFGSKAHLDANQIDIYLEYLEDRELKKLRKDYEEYEKGLQEYRKTKQLLKARVTDPKKAKEIIKQLRQSIKQQSKEKNGGR